MGLARYQASLPRNIIITLYPKKRKPRRLTDITSAVTGAASTQPAVGALFLRARKTLSPALSYFAGFIRVGTIG